MAANIHFLRKLAVDELWDTMFFATGEIPTKTKGKDFYVLKAGELEMKIHSTRKVYVNGDFCRSVPEAKYVVCDLLSSC